MFRESPERRVPRFQIIGDAPEETRKRVEEYHLRAWERRNLREYPKNPKEIFLIGLANQETNTLMEKVGVDPYNVSERNFHLLSPEDYKKVAHEKESAAFSIATDGAIAINANKVHRSLIHFGSAAFHELLHLKGYLALEVQQEGIERWRGTLYREGLSVGAPQSRVLRGEKHRHFDGLHEAIVTQQEKRFVETMLGLPMLEKERQYLDSQEVLEAEGRIAEAKNVDEDDIKWVSEDGTAYWLVGYAHQRRVLTFINEEICKEFPEKYENPEEVELEFLRAHFTGELLPIARLVEETFGKGSFRALGTMDKTEESAITVYDYLKKKRNRLEQNL